MMTKHEPRCAICGKVIEDEDSIYILEKEAKGVTSVQSTFCNACYYALIAEIEKMKIRRAYRGWTLGKD